MRKETELVGVSHVRTCVLGYDAIGARHYVGDRVLARVHCFSVNAPELGSIAFLKASYPVVGKLNRDFFVFGKENVCVVQQIGCVEHQHIAVERNSTIVHTQYPLKECSLKEEDNGKAMAFGCSTRVKMVSITFCGVLDDAAD